VTLFHIFQNFFIHRQLFTNQTCTLFKTFSFTKTQTMCFLDEPNAPGKPDIIDYDNKSVTLKWEPPKSDGGREITHYIIEMLNKYQPDWVEVMPTDTNACEFKVPDLKERMAYQFRVRAVNKAGKSAPSPPTENHIVRHRNRKYFYSREG
jgi:Fibronectin type III domain